MGLLPVKFRLVQIIAQSSGLSNEDIFAIVKREYPRDRHVTQPGIDHYLISLKAVGLIELVAAEIAPSGALLQYYRLTEAGRGKLKYIQAPGAAAVAALT